MAPAPSLGAAFSLHKTAGSAIDSTRRFVRSVWADVLLLALASRVFFIAVAWLGGQTFPQAKPAAWNKGPSFVRYFARWDSGYYMDLAEKGYGYAPEAWAFNPGYPLLVRGMHDLFPGIGYPVAGFVVSAIAFFAAVLLLFGYTRALFDESIAVGSVAVFCFFPGSFYLSAVYADGVFVALLLAFFWSIHRESWLMAGVLGSCAAITRTPGVLLGGALVVAIAIAVWKRRATLATFISLPLFASLPAAFMVYVWRKTGDPSYPNHVREIYWPAVRWHNPLNVFTFEGAPQVVKVLAIASMMLLVLVLGYAAWDLAKRKRIAAAPMYAFVGAVAIIYLAYSEPNPIVRYMIPIVPLYWMGAEVSRTPRTSAILIGGLASIGALVAILFATWWQPY